MAEQQGDRQGKAARWPALRLFGPFSGIGLIAAALTLLADQADKLWTLYVFDLADKTPVTVTPFFDLVLVWNRGISYGLIQQHSALGRLGLTLFALVVTILLGLWLARLTSSLAAVAVGLIMGGALGNGIDRLAYGAVADFFSLHAYGYDWYVFNIADVAIVAGVVGLLYDSLVRGHKKVSNPSKM